MSVFNKLLVYFVGIALVSLTVTGISAYTSSYLKSDLEQIVSKTLPRLVELYGLSEHITVLTTGVSSMSHVQDHADYLEIKKFIDEGHEILYRRFERLLGEAVDEEHSTPLMKNLELIFSNLDAELADIEKLIKNREKYHEKQKIVGNLTDVVHSDLKRIRIVAADHFLQQSELTEEFIAQQADWRTVSKNYQALMDDKFDSAESSFELLFRSYNLTNLIQQIGSTNSAEYVHHLSQQYNLNIHTISRLVLTLDLAEKQVISQHLQGLQRCMAGEENIFQLKLQQFAIERSIQRYKDQNKKLRNDIAGSVERLIQDNRSKITEQVQKTGFLSNIGIRANMVIGVATLLAALWVIRYFVYGNIIFRLKHLTDTTHKLASGQLDVEVQVDGNDELSLMAESVKVFKENAIALENHRVLLEERVEERTLKLTREIDGHKRTTAALQKSEKKFRNLYEFSRDAVLILGEEHIIDCNREALKMFGFEDKEEMAGLHPSVLLPSSQPDGTVSWQGFQDLLRQAFTGQGLLFEWVYSTKSKVEFFSETLLSVTEFADKMVVQAVVRDISKRKQMENDLLQAKRSAEQAAKIKGDFLANMSHEIRTPLNAIIGITHLMGTTKLSTKQDDYLRKMQSSSRLLLGIINDILDFSKIEAGALKLEHADFLLEDVLHDVGDVNAERARDKRLELLYSCDVSLDCYLKGDPLRLVQILNNLVSNAIKFTESGSVVLSAEIEERLEEEVIVRFSVKDTGVGLDKDQQDGLFAAFTQADTSITRKHGGTGLGLSISKRLIELMGGRIWVDCEIGKGCQFNFTVQLGLMEEKQEDAQGILQQFHNLRVLIAADNPELGLILEKILEKYTIEITQVSSGADTLTALKSTQHHFDLIMLDERLRDIKCLELARHLKESEVQDFAFKIIVISVFGNDSPDEQSREVPFDAYLYKPFSPSDVFDAIAVAMGSSQIVSKSMKGSVFPDQHDLEKLQGAKILLVEDNEINQEIATEMLMLVGVQVVVANNGQEAIDILNKEVPDLVLMDIQMPVMDGYEATRRLRTEEKFTDLPILAMTANVMEEDRRKAHDVGMNGHIAKPIDPEELFQMIGKWLDIVPVKISTDVTASGPDKSRQLPLPEIDGLDMKAGLLRTADNWQLYLKLLRKFVVNHKDGAVEIDEALEAGDISLAERLAHTLKSVSGNIGAITLQDTAASVENAIREGDTVSLENDLRVFKDTLAFIIAEICKVLPPEENNHTSEETGRFDAKKVQAILHEVRQYLSEGDAAAGECLKQLHNMPGITQVMEHVKAVESLIEQYAFDEALERLVLLESVTESLRGNSEGAA